MSPSNSANNVFQIGPGLGLRGQDLIIGISANRSTQLIFAAATGVTIEISKPRQHIESMPLLSPSLYYLSSNIKISAFGSYEPQRLLYKHLQSPIGILGQIEAITPEFNSLHDRAEELSRKIYDNIIYAWETVRDKDDIDSTRLTDFSELKGITAGNLKIPSGIKPPPLSTRIKELWSQAFN